MFTITLSESETDRWTSDGPDGEDYRRGVRTGCVVLYRYGAEGEELTARQRRESAHASLEAARAAYERLPRYAAYEPADLHWAGLSEDRDVEAHHDYPAGHPRAHGCGGWAIRRPRKGEQIEIRSADGVTLDAWEAT